MEDSVEYERYLGQAYLVDLGPDEGHGGEDDCLVNHITK